MSMTQYNFAYAFSFAFFNQWNWLMVNAIKRSSKLRLTNFDILIQKF